MRKYISPKQTYTDTVYSTDDVVGFEQMAFQNLITSYCRSTSSTFQSQLRWQKTTIVLAGKNWQQSGAVANATVKEAEEAKVRMGGEMVHVMSMEHYETSLEGLAEVVWF